MDNRTQTHFDMGNVINKLRSIAQEAVPEPSDDINDDNFTKVMSRLASVKNALPEDQFSAIRAGVRSLYMNQRPNPAQLTALTNLLETVLRLVAEDNSLFQRLKTDLTKGAGPTPTPQAPAPAPAGEPPAMGAAPAAEPAGPAMRGLK
jgi:hypothetical protein